MDKQLQNVLKRNQPDFGPVVSFDPKTEKLIHIYFDATNEQASTIDFSNTAKFSAYINHRLNAEKAKFGIGGYNEDRVIYRRSPLFNAAESRSIHLGIDIWGAEGTEVYAPTGGVVHSYANNDNFGDYGATIVLQHQLESLVFYTLYGHLSRNDIGNLKEGKYVGIGELIGHFGDPTENGDWPPHLHFQVIKDMRLFRGDYPGVSSSSESKKYLENCPNPDLVLNLMQYAI